MMGKKETYTRSLVKQNVTLFYASQERILMRKCMHKLRWELDVLLLKIRGRIQKFN